MMDLTYLRILSAGGILVVGLLAIVGSIVISLLAAGVVQAGLFVAGRLARARPTEAEGQGRGGPGGRQAADVGFGFDAGTAHALLARQAWWRLRC